MGAITVKSASHLNGHASVSVEGRKETLENPSLITQHLPKLIGLPRHEAADYNCCIYFPCCEMQ